MCYPKTCLQIDSSSDLTRGRDSALPKKGPMAKDPDELARIYRERLRINALNLEMALPKLNARRSKKDFEQCLVVFQQRQDSKQQRQRQGQDGGSGSLDGAVASRRCKGTGHQEAAGGQAARDAQHSPMNN